MSVFPVPQWEQNLSKLAMLVLLCVVLASCSPTVKYLCPPLSPPPSSVIDALETTGRKDPSAATWTIDLDRHYQKLDACR